MVAFDQIFEARLDLGLGGGVLEVELAQAFALGPAQEPGRFAGGARRRLGFGAKYRERVIGGKAIGKVVAAPGGAIARPGIHPDEPGRAVADGVVLLVLGHVLVRHAGEVIVRLVILADVLKAVAVILALLAAALGRGVETWLSATLPFASRASVAHELGRVGLGAEAVEEFRVEFHYGNYG